MPQTIALQLEAVFDLPMSRLRLFRRTQEELLVRLGALKRLDQHIHRSFSIVHIREDTTNCPNERGFLRIKQQIFLAGAARYWIDRREDPAIGEVAVELELHIARSLELLENDLVHLRSGIDESRGEDGQAG